MLKGINDNLRIKTWIIKYVDDKIVEILLKV